MEKYIVKAIHMFANLIEVEAETEDDARHQALSKIQNSEENFKHYYESTLPIENWAVITKSAFEKVKDKVREQLAEESAKKESSNIITPNIVNP